MCFVRYLNLKQFWPRMKTLSKMNYFWDDVKLNYHSVFFGLPRGFPVGTYPGVLYPVPFLYLLTSHPLDDFWPRFPYWHPSLIWHPAIALLDCLVVLQAWFFEWLSLHELKISKRYSILSMLMWHNNVSYISKIQQNIYLKHYIQKLTKLTKVL